jgi:hypothetical protein
MQVRKGDRHYLRWATASAEAMAGEVRLKGKTERQTEPVEVQLTDKDVDAIVRCALNNRILENAVFVGLWNNQEAFRRFFNWALNASVRHGAPGNNPNFDAMRRIIAEEIAGGLVPLDPPDPAAVAAVVASNAERERILTGNRPTPPPTPPLDGKLMAQQITDAAARRDREDERIGRELRLAKEAREREAAPASSVQTPVNPVRPAPPRTGTLLPHIPVHRDKPEGREG